MNYFKSWEDVEKFLSVGCVSCRNADFFETGWVCWEGCCGDDGLNTKEVLDTLRAFADDDVSNVRLEWVGG